MKVKDLHDYASVFLNENFIGTLDRMKSIDTIQIPKLSDKTITLDILVCALGRNNYGEKMLEERKGITDYVSFEPFTQMNWEVFPLPMENNYLQTLKFTAGITNNKKGIFCKGNFLLIELGDTYLDLDGYKNGFVAVNGHNLGRFLERGPQHRLYCPAPWLKKGNNEIIVFDMEGENIHDIRGYKTSN